MNISKISRSLVVTIFVALILFMGYNDIILLLKNSNNSVALNILKVVYIIVTILLVILYVYIKDKLYRKKIKRNISLVYRYIYLSFIIIIMSIISIYSRLYLFSNIALLIYLILKISIAFILKKIIFNVSKSDILSVFGTFIFAMLPYIHTSIDSLFINLINTLVLFLAILIIQKLIDELKQRGIKNKKYIIISLILGVLVGITILLGVSTYIWLSTALISLILTVNLDKTHICFPKKLIASVNQQIKEMLYKIERINIGKLIVSILVVALISFVVSFIGEIIVTNINMTNSLFINLFNFKINIFDINFGNIITNLNNNTATLLSSSKTFYILMLAYIIIVEVLAFVLRRRYDTKSTLMKLIFILLYLSISVFNLDITNYQTILTVFLILIAIVNTSNIYLNREERVKLLVA